MQSVAMQTKKNEQAAVLSSMALSSYFWSPIWMVGSCALSTASADPSGGRTARRAHQASPRMARSARVAYMASLGVVASLS